MSNPLRSRKTKRAQSHPLHAVVGHGDSVIIEVIQTAVNKLKVPESCEGKMRGEYVKCGMRLVITAVNAAIAEHKRAAAMPNGEPSQPASTT
jgi:hypothetical protein